MKKYHLKYPTPVWNPQQHGVFSPAVLLFFVLLPAALGAAQPEPAAGALAPASAVQRAAVGAAAAGTPAAAPTAPPAAATAAQQAVFGLITRQIGASFAERFVLKITPAATDFFALSASSDSRIVIEGNAGYALAAGFHHYLKRYLHAFAGQLHTAIVLPPIPADLPLPTPERRQSPFRLRNAYNYCTFSYTMPWWTWDDWEKECDLLAMAGVNQPLLIVGLEKVWQQVLLQLHFTEKEIADFIPTPAYTAWWLMANVEGTSGPVSQAHIDAEYELALKIVNRMREFDMTPISQAFFGMVPSSFKKHFPKATVINQGNWGTLKRPEVLAPTDPLFASVADLWYRTLHSLYGTFSFYGGDLFHEGGRTAGIPLSLAARRVQQAMQKASPGSVYVLQGWGANPRPALMLGLDRSHTLVQKLSMDMSQEKGIYPRIDYGKPWTVNLINNFGGGHGLYGNLHMVALLPKLLTLQRNKGCLGLGVLSEGTQTNPVFYDLVAEVFWSSAAVPLEDWLNDYVLRRYSLNPLPSGTVSPARKEAAAALQAAWKLLANDIYHTQVFDSQGQTDSVIAARPSKNANRARSWSSGNQYWDTGTLLKAASLFLAAARQETADGTPLSANLAYDLTDVFRQALQSIAHTAEKTPSVFLPLIQATERLTAANSDFLLGHWLQQAKAKGAVGGAERRYEIAARQLITRWNPKENVESGIWDYSNRTWSGLVGDYYLSRWRLFFEMESDPQRFADEVLKLENRWIDDDTTVYPTQPTGNLIQICSDIQETFF